MTTEQIILKRNLDKARRLRAKANRNRDIIAAMHIDGDPVATLELVAAATIAAIRAERSVQEALEAFQATILP